MSERIEPTLDPQNWLVYELGKYRRTPQARLESEMRQTFYFSDNEASPPLAYKAEGIIQDVVRLRKVGSQSLVSVRLWDKINGVTTSPIVGVMDEHNMWRPDHQLDTLRERGVTMTEGYFVGDLVMVKRELARQVMKRFLQEPALAAA